MDIRDDLKAGRGSLCVAINTLMRHRRGCILLFWLLSGSVSNYSLLQLSSKQLEIPENQARAVIICVHAGKADWSLNFHCLY
jgi:hypothetical protein